MQNAVKIQLIKDDDYSISEVVELNFFDLDGSRSKTSGSSNKFYLAELQFSKTTDQAQIFTIWGPTGGTQTRDWRHYESQDQAKKEFDSLIKSKVKKGYVKIDVAQRALGSDSAKQIVKPVNLKNTDGLIPQKSVSKLELPVQRLVSELFNITNTWVVNTLKCPLGQLTNNQIDEGRARLDQAKTILNATGKSLSSAAQKDIQNLTNEFYSLIPHNLGQGARGQMTHLLLDSLDKIAQKHDDLDTLLDAKAAGASLLQTASIDEKYETLNADIQYVPLSDSVYKWIDEMWHGTRAHNHHYLGKIKIHNIYVLNRKQEQNIFEKNAKLIDKEKITKCVPSVLEPYVKKRPDVTDLLDLYSKTNTLPVWHGTRRQNVVGISMKGLLIRPSGVVLSGSMYGNGTYFATASSKSINYCDSRGTYWAQGSNDKAFMFLCDVAFGNAKIVTHSYHYSKENIKPYHSVWAKADRYNLINDELIVYNPAGADQQHRMRYLIEFETQA